MFKMKWLFTTFAFSDDDGGRYVVKNQVSQMDDDGECYCIYCIALPSLVLLSFPI